jgi:hypothetical protein
MHTNTRALSIVGALPDRTHGRWDTTKSPKGWVTGHSRADTFDFWLNLAVFRYLKTDLATAETMLGELLDRFAATDELARGVSGIATTKDVLEFFQDRLRIGYQWKQDSGKQGVFSL